MIKLICTLLVFPILVQAAPKSEVVLIEKVKWIEQKKMYQLSLHGKAGVYYSKNNLYNCIIKSLRNKSKILATYDSNSLVFTKCVSAE